MTEPNKLTITGILRWIFGVIFLICFLGALIEVHFIAALIALVAVIVLIPPISNAIESKMNFTLSGALRFVLVLCLLVGFGMASPNNTSKTAVDPGISLSNTTTAPTTQNSNVCYWDWRGTLTHNIGSYFSAPSGKDYVIVDLYIKNNADQSISTNPYNWNFVANGITYTVDSATFDNSIKSQSVDVGKGGEVETQMVFLVNGEPSNAEMKYVGLFNPEMARIHHFENNTST